MSKHQHSPALQAELRRTTDLQSKAADPRASAWVSANAGTGKTHVLTTRVLRLLLAGTKPERLLCLTYTKAAAAEMSNRVFKRLAKWVTLEDGKLFEALAGVLERSPAKDELRIARDLFTSAIETPGGLKVQTIHAFCERLLQRFPLEAGVPPGFSILDDEQQAVLVAEATHSVLGEASTKPNSELGRALHSIIRHASDDSFDGLLKEALGRRDWLEAAMRLPSGGEAQATLAARYRQALGLGPKDTEASITAARAGVLKESQLTAAVGVLRTGGKNDNKHAQMLGEALAAKTDTTRCDALRRFFLTTTGEPRDRLMSAALGTEHADLLATLQSAQRSFADLTQKAGCLAVAEASVALIGLAGAVMQRYYEAKTQRAALDFDDLIRAAGTLLGNNSDTQWVLYKLDGGLDHILVDEA
ncbi:MAG: UvrD-helicase domain-containing protein, partial [Proteobacteria bacterium]|nr:UvrD-helicase domain-containing protein [Pseudomonadota bacterium]